MTHIRHQSDEWLIKFNENKLQKRTLYPNYPFNVTLLLLFVIKLLTDYYLFQIIIIKEYYDDVINKWFSSYLDFLQTNLTLSKH